MCWYWFPINNFCRGALISLKVCRRIYHCKIQVNFDISNHPQNFGRVMALFQHSFCCCVDIGFHSITFAGMHCFFLKFAEGYIIIQVEFDIGNHPQNRGQVMAFFDIIAFRDRSDYKDQCFCLFFFFVFVFLLLLFFCCFFFCFFVVVFCFCFFFISCWSSYCCVWWVLYVSYWSYCCV